MIMMMAGLMDEQISPGDEEINLARAVDRYVPVLEEVHREFLGNDLFQAGN